MEGALARAAAIKVSPGWMLGPWEMVREVDANSCWVARRPWLFGSIKTTGALVWGDGAGRPFDSWCSKCGLPGEKAEIVQHVTLDDAIAHVDAWTAGIFGGEA